MKSIWVDLFNGPHVHFFQNIHKFLDGTSNNIHFTARHYYPIPDLLSLYKIEASKIGKHGGKSLYDKLIASTRRVRLLSEHINQKKDISLVIHKHSVEAARVAWGLGIPSISFLDNEIMVPQNMLVCPLSNVLIAPMCIDYSVIRSFTPGHVRLFQYDGVSEVANVYKHEPDENLLTELDLDTNKPIILIRSSPILAAYNTDGNLANHVVKQIREQVEDAQIIHFKRDGEEQTNAPVSDARSLFHFADIVISGGGTMSREAALLGANAITYFGQPLAVDRYLIDKGLLQSFRSEEILKVNWKRQLKKRRKKVNLNDFEHPFSLIERAVKVLDI